jgi:hypothetical protein
MFGNLQMPARSATVAKIFIEDRYLMSFQQRGPPHEAMSVSLGSCLGANFSRGASDGGDNLPRERDLVVQENCPRHSSEIIELFFAHQNADQVIRDVVNPEGIPQFSVEFSSWGFDTDATRAFSGNEERLMRRSEPRGLAGHQFGP